MMPLEAILEYLSRFGRPHLWRMTDGDWACRVEMFVTGQGVSFEVKHLSGKSPMEALEGCKRNMEAALADLAAAHPRLKE